MTQERIKYFEDLLQKPMAEPHRGWIEELLQAVSPKTEKAFKASKSLSVRPEPTE